LELVKDKNYHPRALIISLVIHILIVCSFLFFKLQSHQAVAEESGGYMEFGWDESAAGNVESNNPGVNDNNEEIETAAVSNPSKAADSEVKEILTDETSDVSVASNKKKEVKKKTESKKITENTQVTKEVKKETISNKLNNALSDAWKTGSGGGGSGSQGDGEGIGNQGSPNGGNGKGVLGGNGTGWELSGRSMASGFGTKIKTTKESGVVVLNIYVDRQGNVTRVTQNLKESDTTSPYLFDLAKNDVLKNFKFTTDGNAAVEQKGKMRYVFQLK
jgi:periplasmic protein TonB